VVIERGQRWGEPGSLRDGEKIARSDVELRRFVEQARRAGSPLGRTGLLGGDLCRTVGGPGDQDRLIAGGSVLPIDVARAVVDGRDYWFCAHLVARHPLWLGRTVVVMNAQWHGPLKLGPRAHPNDGLLDVTDGALPLGDRAEARRRARTGSHLPHPALDVRRTASAEFHFDRPISIWLDGERITRRAHHLVVQVEPDAGEIVV
jgi:hypothetical protein